MNKSTVKMNGEMHLCNRGLICATLVPIRFPFIKTRCR